MKATTRDTAADAVMFQQLRRAVRVSCCAMCANPRRVEGDWIVCPHCGDAEPVNPAGKEG